MSTKIPSMFTFDTTVPLLGIYTEETLLATSKYVCKFCFQKFFKYQKYLKCHMQKIVWPSCDMSTQ